MATTKIVTFSVNIQIDLGRMFPGSQSPIGKKLNTILDCLESRSFLEDYIYNMTAEVIETSQNIIILNG